MSIEKMDTAKTGTTTLGMVCDGAVVVATDTRVTMGNYIAHHKGKKLYMIDRHLAMTIAGSVADAQNVIDIAKYYAAMYRMDHERRMPVSAASRLIANIFFNQRYNPLIAQIILAGFDDTGPALYNVDYFGSLTSEKYTSTGSGSPIVLGILEAEYREGMTVSDTVRLAVKSVTSAMKRDTYSGDSFDVAVIDKDGFRELTTAEKDTVLHTLQAN
ncbi:MAG: proteasome subunit beta [Conexivisphaerales archaeon]